MDFLTDPIFTDLGRSDFIGGIDNEALDFGHLEQFMQVAASVGAAVETNDTNGNVIDASATKTESPTTPLPNATTISISNRPIATVSARVSLATPTTPIATPLAANINSTQAHLPESPPDSGSEPPYSPLQDIHGLTLTSRDSLAATNGGVIFNGLSATAGLQSHQHTLAQSAIHLSPQFTPPHSQYHQHHQSTNPHFPHHSHSQQPQHYLNNAHHMELERGGEIRIKHEAGLIMHASNLVTQQQSPSEAHLELTTQQSQLLYAAGSTVTTFESEVVGLYGGSDYQHMGNTAGTLGQAAICLMNPETATPRVHVIGTATPQTQSNRSSAPSTPIHRSSTRKRKMSTQLDCAEFPGMKADPGLNMSPVGKMNCNTPYPFTPESQKLGPTSPVSISLPTPSGDCINSAHSSASLSPALSTVNSNQENSLDGSVAPSTNGENGDANALTPCIRFSPFQPQNWHKLCDQSLQELSVVYYRVDADKGFNFSVSDDAFVCQKKNHFQVTCHARLQGDAKFVKTPSGLEKIKAFHLHFYGVKLESPNQTIRVEQSQSDRSKKPFYPVPIDLQSHIVSKITVGRLHFSETTNNNMRKKGRPNPEQRYFQLVVGLHVHTMSGNFPVISQGSERIIVRASNPGQFESDVDLCWQRGITQDSIFHAGRVGINTDRPDESLVVHGNLKVSGHIVQPSDSRAKQEIGELDTSVQLRNLQKIRIVRYRYEPEFAIHSGLRRASASDSEEIVDTGVIAQEVREVIPDAVQEAGSITLPNGSVIENFLLVNKDRILMENIGAVKELCKVTGHLESRIESLELMNSRLMRKKEYDLEREANRLQKTETCSNRNLQIIIFMLVIIMAACLTAVSTLYFLEHNKQHHNSKRLERLQQQHPSGSLVHDAQQLTEQERHYLQLRNFLHSNASKTHASWPDYFFGLTTTRPPSFVRSKSPLGIATQKNITATGQEIAYNESGEFYSANGRTDELAVVMEKPVLSLQPLQSLQETHRITTSAPTPIRSNKTVTSKNKLKWPLPQVVLRAASTMQQVPSNNGFKHDILAVAGNIVEITSLATARIPDFEPVSNDTQTSTERVSAAAIPQDFENNSIDIDARQTTTRKKSSGNKLSSATLSATVSPNSASHDTALEIASDNTDIALNIDRHLNSDNVASTSSSNSMSLAETTATANNVKLAVAVGVAETSIFNVYKTITPTTPSSAITTHRIGENHSGATSSTSSLEVPPLSNKSEGVLESPGETADALDLQNLSNNNESADNPVAALFGIDLTGRDSVLGLRSTTDHRTSNTWIQRKTVEVETFGAPEQCLQHSSRDDISNCQSVCFEGSNQLSAPRQHIRSPSIDSKNTIPILEHQPQNVDSSVEDDDVEVDAEPIDEIEETQKLPIASFIVKKQNSTIIATGKISHATQAIAKQFSSERNTKETDTLEIAKEHPTSDEHFENVAKLDDEKLIDHETSISIVANRPPTSNCHKISGMILSDTLNNTFATDDFCPNTGRSLNATYVIPISKYFKEPGFEMHFSSPTLLLWTICRDSEHTKRDGKLLIPTGKGVILPTEQNTSVMGLTIPSHGYFVRDLELRSSDDLTKDNLCLEQANDANTILQYNIRILRDCD